MVQSETPVHPIIGALTDIAESVKSVADVNPTFMSPAQKAEALTGLAELENQLAELKMRVLADADDLAASSGARDVSGWLAHHTHIRRQDANAQCNLAVALERRNAATATAMRAGRVNPAQAQVITSAIEQLAELDAAAGITAEILTRAEDHLIEQAATFGPRELARLAYRLLEVIAPELADEAEARRLAALEEQARRRTKLTLRRLGDGTTRLSARLPDSAATRLGTYLEAFTNPRKAVDAGDAESDQYADRQGMAEAEGVDVLMRLSYPRRLGQAFCSLLETLDPRRLPIHGGDATTVIVTIPLESLHRELATADLLTAVTIPGGGPPDFGLEAPENSGEVITADEARRLACNAQLIPAVLGTDSEILDLGRSARLYNKPQRRALLIRDQTCRAETCDVPGAWCEAHHLKPWSHGGSTDLKDGVLLCSTHHHRMHDPTYLNEQLPSGEIRFKRR